jgi:zinc transporter 1/2/3
MLLPSTEALTSACLPEIFTSYPAFSYAFALFAALASHLTEHFVEASLMQSADSSDQQQDNTDNGAAGLSPGPLKENENEESSASVRKSNYAMDCRETSDESTDYHDDKQRRKAKQFSKTLVVELSLSIHSVLVGLALGVTFDQSFKPLFVALAFHQMLEGVALGCRLAESVLGFANEMMFSVIFSLSCPIGVIIGISAYHSVNQSGETFLIIQGFVDGISGGLLLYNGFLLLLKDFPEDMAKHCRGDRQNLKKFGMFGALWIAAFSMSIIGGWA